MKYCSKCGSANADEAAFCASCGTPLEQARTAPTPPPSEPAPASEAPQSVPFDQPANGGYSTQPQGTYSTNPNPAYTDPNQSYANPYAAPAAGEEPKNESTLWLILNIACALLCCLPLGVAGAILAGLASSSFTKGDFADVANKIKISKILFFVGIGLGIITIIISLVVFIPAIIAANS